MKNDSLYFIIEHSSGDLLLAAEKFRSDYHTWLKETLAYVKTFGAVSFRDAWGSGIGAVEFGENPVPPEFRKTTKRGIYVPRKKSKYVEEFAMYRRPNVADYLQNFMSMDSSIQWSVKGKSTGCYHVGNWDTPYGLYWYSNPGPILLITPDFVSSIKRLQKDEPGVEITNGVDRWKAPKGCRKILKEEWDLMQAKHDYEKKVAA